MAAAGSSSTLPVGNTLFRCLVTIWRSEEYMKSCVLILYKIKPTAKSKVHDVMHLHVISIAMGGQIRDAGMDMRS